MMKKILAFLIVLLLCFSLFACGEQNTPPDPDNGPVDPTPDDPTPEDPTPEIPDNGGVEDVELPKLDF